jgi:ketosteroid isomerase-like protein
VASEVDGPAPEVGEPGGDGLPHTAVEAGGVGEQDRWTVAAEIVDHDLDAVGGGDAMHGLILAGGGSILRVDRSRRRGTCRRVEVHIDTSELVAVATANQAFYDAFEARDLDAMSELWEHSDRVMCTHPGWTVLRGWGAVGGSWVALFQQPVLQFILTNERVEVEGDTAWVSVDENILGDRSGATVAALNLFVRTEGRWKMVAHHGSGIFASQEDDG